MAWACQGEVFGYKESMLTEIENLRVLQERDRSIEKIDKDLEKIPKKRAMIEAQLKDDLARRDRAKMAMQQGEVEVKEIELRIATRRDTIGKLQKQQFETKKNDEYAAIGSEIKRYEHEVDKLETEELEAMERVDGLRAVLESAQGQLDQTQSSIDEELADLAKWEENSRAQKVELMEVREQLVSKIDASLNQLYDRLRRKKGPHVVVPVSESGQCGSCHMKVTPETLHRANAQASVVQCENCAAILFPG